MLTFYPYGRFRVPAKFSPKLSESQSAESDDNLFESDLNELDTFRAFRNQLLNFLEDKGYAKELYNRIISSEDVILSCQKKGSAELNILNAFDELTVLLSDQTIPREIKETALVQLIVTSSERGKPRTYLNIHRVLLTLKAAKVGVLPAIVKARESILEGYLDKYIKHDKKREALRKQLSARLGLTPEEQPVKSGAGLTFTDQVDISEETLSAFSAAVMADKMFELYFLEVQDDSEKELSEKVKAWASIPEGCSLSRQKLLLITQVSEFVFTQNHGYFPLEMASWRKVNVSICIT